MIARISVVVALFGFSSSQAVDSDVVVLTLKVVKKAAGMASSKPTVKFLADGEKWSVREEISWSGENEREIFFTIRTADAKAPMPRVGIMAPGVDPSRVIVGKTDVAFEHRGDATTFTVVGDQQRSMQAEQILEDPENGLGINIFHNWKIRQDGPFRGKPFPQVEVRAVLNYLVAAREALKLLGGTGPRDRKPFEGNLKLMSFEIAGDRGHDDYPPHVHIMLWVPGYTGGEIPHFYMDASGKIVRNGFIILGAEKGKATPALEEILKRKETRAGVYGPGKPCELRDLNDKVALVATVTPEGGLLLGRGTGEDRYLLIGDTEGPGEAVLVKRGDAAVVRARVEDDAERGETKVTVEHLKEGKVARSYTQELKYDPFTGLAR